ncbi:MAG: sulfurtransferase TusA family protein, partial [Gammaproteobacteria bacterium]|nr:sulfurtransferase TusA family protein [Gammaproteobacteria bacterium]
MSTTVVDARNLLCPMPVIRAQDAVVKLQPGDTVQVLCTDPGVVHDIP